VISDKIKFPKLQKQVLITGYLSQVTRIHCWLFS